jgi:AmiR/NasT family two-component response regulator
MGEHQIAEEQAYKIMQRAAMDGRRPLVDVARSIIERADEIKNALKSK